MKKLLLIACLALSAATQAQIVSSSSFIKPVGKFDVGVPFAYGATGIQTPLEWGLDLAWLSEDNVRTGIFFAGQELIDIIRLSYRPTHSVEDGSLSSSQRTYINNRSNIVKTWCKDDIKYYINDDHDSVDDWYDDTTVSSEERGRRWAQVIDLTIDRYMSNGLTNLVAIAPFNEPDYTYTGQGASGYERNDYVNVCKALKTEDEYKDKYADVRISGPNTLNPDYAYTWWNSAKDYIDEGATHQLAGTFDNYASFFQTITDNGLPSSNDELHNVMECIVGAEYGMQTGIWWGTCEYARSQFMKATYHRDPGSRLGYGEHRDNWTVAAVYRHSNGQVQAFGGASERQAVSTDYVLCATDRPVWYAGARGREYLMHIEGGNGYQVDQPNMELCLDIQCGEDIMPYLTDGTYKIMNVNSGLLMGFSSSPTSGWVSTVQRNDSSYPYMQWNIKKRTTGDISYYRFTVNNNYDMYLDILNWNYSAGANVGAYPGGGSGTIEQWYLEYAGNGAFYIRSRYNALCLEVADASTSVNGNIQMGDFTGEANQQWRFIPTDATPDLEAPLAPSNLKADMQQASIHLTWDPSESEDVTEYAVVRNGSVIVKLDGCEYTDNEAEPDSSYTYYIYAIDQCYNYSPHSNEVTNCSITDEKGIFTHLTFDNTVYDETPNGNHCAVCGDTIFVTDNGHEAISLSGTDNYMQLPYTIANHDAMTITFWLRYSGGDAQQRVFDFGNGPDQYMCFTSNSGSGPRFTIKNGDEELIVDGGRKLTNTKWYHIAVTIGDDKACLYMDGELKGSGDLTIKPTDIRPVLNYIGRSQSSSDPYLKAYLSDFTIYNYALTAEEVAALEDEPEETGVSDIAIDGAEALGKEYNISGRPATDHDKGVIIRDGKKVLMK